MEAKQMTVLMVGALIAAIHPWAATGAAFGCCFFLASPVTVQGWRRFNLGVFSFGVGYAAGVFFYGEGPPFSTKAMLVSASAAALGAVTMTAFYSIIERNGALPAWLDALLDLVPFRKRGKNDDA